MRRPDALGALLLVVMAACGGGDADLPPSVATPPTSAPTTGISPDSAQDTAALAPPDLGLVRETFAYSPAGRDPFISLMTSGSVRPFPRDLRVTGITFDPRYPQRSVATVRDTTNGRRYSLRVGDQVGRIRVTEIRPRDVVLTLEEFGVERQIVLSLRRRQEGTP